jgi:hypothetical protein
MKTARTDSLKVAVEYSMTNNIRSEDIKEELGIIGINTIIKTLEVNGKHITN